MLLEEVLLHLLRSTGYRTVDTHVGDITLKRGSSGLEVRGRGYNHQIDAIADFQVSHPFSYPQRLLVEAKCFSPGTLVGIEIVRNAVGVLKDASEFWVSTGISRIHKARYHYQYAVFSATGYTDPAQSYAYAQDVYLIPVNSKFMISAIKAIRAVSADDFGVSPSSNIPISLTKMREEVRQSLTFGDAGYSSNDYSNTLNRKLSNLFQESFRIGYALLAVLGGRFPVFLTPIQGLPLYDRPPRNQIRIRWDYQGWYIESIQNERLFSFDLPPELFELYASGGALSARQAINLKDETMREFYAFLTVNGSVRVINFELDGEWLATIRDGISRRQPSRGE